MSLHNNIASVFMIMQLFVIYAVAHSVARLLCFMGLYLQIRIVSS